ncbi:MAG TPA: NusG domain II-containing protein [candidate division Zixibacteria bacterium]|nr:NusG domain II-containing protein [candidate division Zixibacteria bacterium]
MRLKPAPLDLLPILIAIAIALLPLIPNDKHAETVVVYRSHERRASVPMSRDTSFVVDTDIGEWTVRIESGEVFVTEAHCPKRICVGMGRISRPGSAIVCAPGKVAVVIEGGEELDAVTR